MAAVARLPAACSGDAESAPSTPTAFLRWLHGDLRHRVCIVSRLAPSPERDTEVYRDHTVHRDSIGLQLQCPDLWLDAPDTYVMLHETRRQRLASDVVALKAFVVDLDCHQPGDPDPELALQAALERLDTAGLPRPHLCVRTGRGAQLIWRIRRVGLKKARRNAQIRWAKAQLALARICGPQADPSLVDLPRIIRLPGTINTRAPLARQRTGADWVEGASFDDYGFDDLCDAALGVARRAFVAQYRSRQAVNDDQAREPSSATRRRTNPSPAKQAQTGDTSTDEDPAQAPPGQAAQRTPAGHAAGFANLARIANARLRDLEKIADRFFLAGIPEGYRDTFAMAVATDLAWVTPLQQADHFADLAIRKLRMMGCVVDERTRGACKGRVNPPLSIAEARRNLGSVVQRFRDAAAGAKVEFGGELRDPRYWYGTERRWAALAPLIGQDEDLLGQLEEILPKHRRRKEQDSNPAGQTPGPDAASSSDGHPLAPGCGAPAAGARARARAPGPKPARQRDRVAEGRYKRPRPTAEDRRQALSALAQGSSTAVAARAAGVTERTIRNWQVQARCAASEAPTANLLHGQPASAPPTIGPAPEAADRDLDTGSPGRKKRPSPYMALPGGLPGISSVVGQAECGQPTGLSITERVSLDGGQLSNRLAGHPHPCGVDERVVHQREYRGGSSARGGGAGEGVGSGSLPGDRASAHAAPGVPPAARAINGANYLVPGQRQERSAMLGSILQVLIERGALPLGQVGVRPAGGDQRDAEAQ